jgi:hypothetical protein
MGFTVNAASFQRVKSIVFGVFALTIVIYIQYQLSVHNKHLNDERKSVVCPSFLSIARSSRDTLIVMRNEPLCTAYVLDNLQ